MSSAPEPVISNAPRNGPNPTTDNVNCAFVFIPFPKYIVDFCISRRQLWLCISHKYCMRRRQNRIKYRIKTIGLLPLAWM